MRGWVAGLVVVLAQSAALAQVTGFVESVGFDNNYRPNCWTPMLVNLTSQSDSAQDYQIQIVQQDLDKDNVTFTRDITLNAGVQQKFWAYFVPQPTDGGLPAKSMDALQKVLRVYLSTRPDSGGHTKQLLQLPVRLTLNDLDPAQTGFEAPRGQRLVLWITDGSSRPTGLDYDHTVGTMEDVTQVSLHPRDLPENVLGYEAVDVVLWLSGNADELDEAGAHRKEALEQFVRRGGELVVCQTEQVHQIDALSDLLPIDPREVKLEDRKSLDPLPSLSVSKRGSSSPSARWLTLGREGTFKSGRAKAKDDAVVEEWIDWTPDGSDRTPWLARRPLGLGSVAWVAEDLGDPLLSLTTSGWPMIWDHVFGWNNSTVLNPTDEEVQRFTPASADLAGTDLTHDTLYSGTDQEGRGAGLLGVAIVFFVLYWVAAGPGSFLVLSGRKRKELSWFVFGAAAIVAAAFTGLLVKLILRGDPELKHMSVSQTALGDHTHVLSRIGLYIPRDGNQSIELNDTADDAQSMLCSLIVHPHDIDNTEFPAAQDYTVPVHDPDEPVAIDIPFRSTLKKIEARWVGDQQGGVVGTAKLVDPKQGYISGTLTNQTGSDLANVYFFFHHPAGSALTANWVLFIPDWKKGDQLDLGHVFAGAPLLTNLKASTNGADWNKDTARGWIDGMWSTHWYSYFDGIANSDGSASGPRAELPMLTVMDLLPPPMNTTDKTEQAVGILRRGGRNLDLGPAVLSGELVILAEAGATPVPCPMVVDGHKMTGDGTTIYQVVLPLDHSAVNVARDKDQ